MTCLLHKKETSSKDPRPAEGICGHPIKESRTAPKRIPSLGGTRPRSSAGGRRGRERSGQCCVHRRGPGSAATAPAPSGYPCGPARGGPTGPGRARTRPAKSGHVRLSVSPAPGPAPAPLMSRALPRTRPRADLLRMALRRRRQGGVRALPREVRPAPHVRDPGGSPGPSADRRGCEGTAGARPRALGGAVPPTPVRSEERQAPGSARHSLPASGRHSCMFGWSGRDEQEDPHDEPEHRLRTPHLPTRAQAARRSVRVALPPSGGAPGLRFLRFFAR